MEKEKMSAEDRQFYTFFRIVHAQGAGSKSILELSDMIKESDSIEKGEPTLQAIQRALDARTSMKIGSLCMDPKSMSVDPQRMPAVKANFDRMESMRLEMKAKKEKP